MGRSPKPLVGRRGRLASLGAPEAKVLLVYAGIGASTFSYEGVDAASDVLHDRSLTLPALVAFLLKFG